MDYTTSKYYTRNNQYLVFTNLRLKQVDGINSINHVCVCLIGWQGLNCAQCRPYWQCPNQDPSPIDSDGKPRVPACMAPNQCFCDSETTEKDETNYCNLAELNNRNNTDVL